MSSPQLREVTIATFVEDRVSVLHATLSYESLEECYQSCSYGANEPMWVKAAPATCGQIGDLLWALTPESLRTEKTRVLFNAAEVRHCEWLPEGVVWMRTYRDDGTRAEAWLILHKFRGVGVHGVSGD